jgi:hypothetical protein
MHMHTYKHTYIHDVVLINGIRPGGRLLAPQYCYFFSYHPLLSCTFCGSDKLFLLPTISRSLVRVTGCLCDGGITQSSFRTCFQQSRWHHEVVPQQSAHKVQLINVASWYLVMFCDLG